MHILIANCTEDMTVRRVDLEFWHKYIFNIAAQRALKFDGGIMQHSGLWNRRCNRSTSCRNDDQPLSLRFGDEAQKTEHLRD